MREPFTCPTGSSFGRSSIRKSFSSSPAWEPHVPDNGGAQPGVYYLAVDSVAEGLNIPPIKLVEKGQINDDILDLILANNRLPDMMRREVSSLIGSTAVAERRLMELLDRYGKKTVLASIGEMMDRTEKAVRAEISKWPKRHLQG